VSVSDNPPRTRLFGFGNHEQLGWFLASHSACRLESLLIGFTGLFATRLQQYLIRPSTVLRLIHQPNMSVRSSIPRSRLLTTLTSATPAASTLVPPYSHSQAKPEGPSPSLRPPYAHQSLSESQKKVQSRLRYTLVDRTAQSKEAEEKYLAWASSIGEGNVQKVWLETLAGLQAAEGSGVSTLIYRWSCPDVRLELPRSHFTSLLNTSPPNRQSRI
jgi:hypothetical protein